MRANCAVADEIGKYAGKFRLLPKYASHKRAAAFVFSTAREDFGIQE